MRKIGKMLAQTKVIILFFFIFALFIPRVAMAAEEMKEVALDFDDVDIRLFIRVISELTGKNFVIDNNVRGKVTVLSPKKLTTRQAYDVFKSVLAVNGFTLVEAGEVIKIVPAQRMSGYGLPLSSRKVLRADDQFITQVIPLKYLDAKTLQPIIKPLLSKQATIFPAPSSDLLIITDYKSNIRKIDSLLDEIDIEVVDTVVEKLDLKYSPAIVCSSKITEILQARYGKNRKGTRAVFFKIVPLERINSILVVASSDISMEIRSILSKIDQPTPEGKSLLNVYYLENADAEDMVKILTKTHKGMSGIRGVENLKTASKPLKTEAGGVVVGGKFKTMGKDISITADKSTNSLIIYAKPDDYNSIREMIKKLDIPRKQVFIEALIMEVSPNEQFNFGTEWEGFRDVGHPFTDQSRAGVIVGSKVEHSPLDAMLGAGAIALGSGFSLGMIGEGISVGNFTFPSLGVLIRATDSLSTVNVLSKPQLLTLNNESASINISENRPFETSTTNTPDVGTTQNLEYRDIGIKMEITPHINKAGKIRLEIKQEINRVSSLVTATQPVTRKRAIDTVVEVQNGHTIIIGGLLEEQRDFSRGQVPCLGGLPFMGWAFKSVGVTDTKTNLLIFISPRVIETGKDADTLSREKVEHMERERALHNEEVEEEKPFFMEYDQKKKPALEEERKK